MLLCVSPPTLLLCVSPPTLPVAAPFDYRHRPIGHRLAAPVPAAGATTDGETGEREGAGWFAGSIRLMTTTTAVIDLAGFNGIDVVEMR